MRCSVVFFLSDLNRDITCAQELREQELALQELVPQVLALLLLSLQALPVSFLVQTDSQPTRTKMLLTSAPKA